MTSIWAFVERLVPRGGTALVMLLLAMVVTPADVGVYTLSMMLVMLVQTMTDGSVRGIAISAVSTRKGRRFLRSYQRWASLLGTVVVAVGLLIIWMILDPQLRPTIAGALPLVLMPAAAAVRVRATADLQIEGWWRSLARSQSIATFVSLAISIPVLFATQSIVASSLQAVLTEVIFSFLVLRSMSRVEVTLTEAQVLEGLKRRPRPEMLHISGYQLLGWVQSQADRLLVGAFVGPGGLGQWSFAQNIARAAGDSLAASTTNVLRPALFSGDDRSSREGGRQVLDRALIMVVVVELIVVIVALTLLPVLLDADWDPAIHAVPMMALSCVMTTLNWSLSIYLLKADRIFFASPIKVVGIVMAMPIALVAVHDFGLAAWMLLARESVEALLLLIVTRKVVPWSSVLRYAAVVGVSSALLLVFHH
ncbi:oligosaccharide flippase family protein [Kocuria palustris]|uniref:oligosaccharide flippase family protein n=1 Tax=Kocuria palustris TaxID=71999 RepID=UPI0009EE7FE2|nr:oligosaccharide flippase family protein [Kocuria palustris]